MQQFRAPFTPDRRDNAELHKMRSDRINHRSLLADDRIACAMKHQVVLLPGRLCGTNREQQSVQYAVSLLLAFPGSL
jgi:hypothetical protein